MKFKMLSLSTGDGSDDMTQVNRLKMWWKQSCICFEIKKKAALRAAFFFNFNVLQADVDKICL